MANVAYVLPSVSVVAPARKTFVLALVGNLWHLTDTAGECGGMFLSRKAALDFARDYRGLVVIR